MSNDLPAPTAPAIESAPPAVIEAVAPALLEQVPSTELADLRRRADKYRFLFKTIVTVTAILVVAMLIVVLAAIMTDT